MATKGKLNGSADLLADAFRKVVDEALQQQEERHKQEVKKETGAVMDLLGEQQGSIKEIKDLLQAQDKRFDALENRLDSVESQVKTTQENVQSQIAELRK